ncbi:PH domain-containing protein [Wenzhouxiangella sediminis]|uniref:PH domain-containing protein n=1 Tax=Wenzhouxiangella sediminis TaxID=1792836 RepID=A0A3E1K5K0_9GAMM|nr:PH domain-containing protein [Wenzhouxiangella sediminis]RFF29313.1 PH domain-containing protein [Wenzhouxiangella sediminis]
MTQRSPVLRQAEIMPEVVRYQTWSVFFLLLFMVVTIPLMPIVLPLAWWLTKRYYERLEIVLTRRDLKVRRGILNVEEKSIPLEKVTDLALYQGPLMRLFDLKGMKVETAGQSSGGALVSVVGIRDVDDFRDAVLNQRDRISDQDDDDGMRQGAKPTESGAAAASGESLALLTEIRDSLQRIERGLADRGD